MPEDPGYRYLNLENTWSGKLHLQSGVVLRSDGAITLSPALKVDATILELPAFSSSLTGSFGISADANGNLYIADPVNHRILYRDACTGTVNPLPCLGGEGSLPSQLRTPRGLLVGVRSILYILDSGNHRIQLVDLQTQQLRGIWGQSDPYTASETVADSGIFNTPQDIVVDRVGEFYLLDQTNRTDGINRVQKLNQNGQVDASFTTTITSQSIVPQNPAYLAIAQLDNQEVLLILDRRTDQADRLKPGKLLIYQLDGTYNQTLSDRWSTLALEHPSGLAVALDTLYVADHNRIFLYNLQGQQQGEVQGLSPTISSLSLDEQERVLVYFGSQGKVVAVVTHTSLRHIG